MSRREVVLGLLNARRLRRFQVGLRHVETDEAELSLIRAHAVLDHSLDQRLETGGGLRGRPSTWSCSTRSKYILALSADFLIVLSVS